MADQLWNPFGPVEVPGTKKPAPKPKAPPTLGQAIDQATNPLKYTEKPKGTPENPNQFQLDAQKARGGKSFADTQKTVPGTWEYSVAIGRKSLGIKEGSADDQSLKSLLWMARDQLGRVSQEDAQKAYRRVLSAKNGSIRERAAIDQDIQAFRSGKNPALVSTGQTLPFDNWEEALRTQGPVKLTRDFGPYKKGQVIGFTDAEAIVKDFTGKQPEFKPYTEDQQALDLAPRAAGNAGFAGKSVAQQEADLKAAREAVAKPVTVAATAAANVINPLGITTTNNAVGSFVGGAVADTAFSPLDLGQAIADPKLSTGERIGLGINALVNMIPALGDLPIKIGIEAGGRLLAALGKAAEPSGFVAVSKLLREAGVENADSIAKEMMQKASTGELGQIQKLGEQIDGKPIDLTDPRIAAYGDMNAPKPGEPAIPYRMRDGKPVIRVQADSREVPGLVKPAEDIPKPATLKPEIPASPRITQPQQPSHPEIDAPVLQSAVEKELGIKDPPKIKTERSTGLANQVQTREAVDGVISQIESTRGKSAEAWQEIGRKSGITSESASKLAADIASGDQPITGEAFGKLLEGKRLKLAEIADLRAKAAENPGKYAEKLFDAEAELQTYLENVQSGKGQWSDIGRALQAGTTIDYGNFEDVLVRVKQSGREVSEKLKADLKAKSDDYARLEAEIQNLRKQQAQNAINTARRSANPAKIATIKQDRAALIDQLKSLRNTSGVGSKKTRGAASVITAEDIKVLKDQAILIKQIAESYVKEGAVRLEDVILKVKAAFKEQLNTEIEDQAIIDSLALTEQLPPKSELAQNLANLRSSARKLSTESIANREAKQATAWRKHIEDLTKRGQVKAETARQKTVDAIAKALQKEEAEAASKVVKDQTAKANKTISDAAKRAHQERLTNIRQALKDFDEQWNREDKLFQTNQKIADLEQQLADGRYQIQQKKTVADTRVDTELEEARARQRVLQKQIEAAIRDQYKSTTGKVVSGVLDFARGAQLGADIGVVTRQGLFAISRPKSFLRGIINAGKSTFSETALARVEQEIENATFNGRRIAPIRQKAGLSLTTSVNASEELSFSRLIAKIPFIGKYTGGSLERFQAAFINTVRADIFDQAVRVGFTPDELALRAKFINNATGRGNVKQVPKLLQAIMTSPRYEASRWAMLGEPLRNAGALGKDALTGKGLNRAAIANIQDMAVTAATLFSLFKLSEAAGYTVNYDTTSSDFLKMRKGDEVWDVSAGLAPRIRDTMRLCVGILDPGDNNNYVDIAGKTISRTINPAVRTPVEIGSKAFQREVLGQTNPKGLAGFTVNEGEADGLFQLSPLIVQSFLQAYQEEGPKAATRAALKEFVGGSVNRYKASSKPTPMQELQKKIKKRKG